MNEVNSDISKDDIAKLVQDLPELYQPAYGFPEFTSAASRSCQDRLAELAKIYDAAKKILGRDLKVLDLGCAQGFFSLSLAVRGATVHGVDFLDKNIVLCKALAKTVPGLSVTFEIAKIEDVINNITKNQYDVVLGLSVFHHLIHTNGIDFVKDIIMKLAENINIGVFELALKQEPLYWGPSQPDDPESLLESYAFVHEVTKFSTHLSEIQRPFIFASNYMWWLDGQMGRFRTHTTEPHPFACGTHERSRHYYFGDGLVVKTFRSDIADREAINLQEFTNEVNYLTNFADIPHKPKLYLSGKNDRSMWIVREYIKGRLLTEIFNDYSYFPPEVIINDIINQLVMLEKNGLYHNDIRCWNVLSLPDGHFTLTDYGSISTQQYDCVWPENIFYAFIIFTRETFARKTEHPDPIRPPLLNIGELPQPYRGAFNKFFAGPEDKWSFAFLKECIEFEKTDQEPKQDTNTAIYKFFACYEDAAKQYKNTLQHNQNMLQQAEAQAQNAEANIQRLMSKIQAAQSKEQSLTEAIHNAEIKAQHAETRAINAETKLQAAELRAAAADTKNQNMETRIQIAELRATTAESKAQNAEMKILLAETKTRDTEARAAAAEAQVQGAEARAVAAEAQVQGAEARAVAAEARVQGAEARAVAAEARVQGAEARAVAAEARVQGAEARAVAAEARVQGAEARANNTDNTLNAVLHSRSWHIMAPYRFIGDLVKEPKQVIKKSLKPVGAKLARFICERPKLKELTLRQLNKYPHLKARLRVFYHGYVVPNSPAFKNQISIQASNEIAVSLQATTQNTIFQLPMTDSALKVYAELKNAMMNNRMVK